MLDKKLLEHLYHPFYKKVDEITNHVRLTQIKKGAEKYPEPFTPSNWTGKELSIHALQELRDAQVYVVGLYERVEELERELKDWKEMFYLLKSDHELDENWRTDEWRVKHRNLLEGK